MVGAKCLQRVSPYSVCSDTVSKGSLMCAIAVQSFTDSTIPSNGDFAVLTIVCVYTQQAQLHTLQMLAQKSAMPD